MAWLVRGYDVLHERSNHAEVLAALSVRPMNAPECPVA
jgi:hypothetical protein